MILTECRRLVGALLIAIIVGGSGDGWAQTRSMMAGTVRDGAGAALAGATVTLESPSVPGGAQTTSTNARGVYRFPTLPSGVYELTAALQGLQPVKRTELRVSVGTTLTVDLTLHAAGVPDAITTNGASPVVDVTTAASTVKLTIEDLENLPFAGAVGLLQLVPGVTPNSALGSGADTNQLTVDGGPITFSLRTGAASAAAHPYWMEGVQIVGLGADADHGEFSGVVENIAMRSGSNRFSGLLEHKATPPQFVGDNRGGLPETLRPEFPPQEILSRWASEAQIGGPIKRDRLFFFSGFQYNRNKVVQAGRIGHVPLDSRAPASFTRLNWASSRNLNVEGSIERNQNRSTGALGRNALPETANDARTRLWSWNARATWTLNPKTLVELRNGGVDYQELGIPGARRAGPAPRSDRVTGILSGNIGQFGDLFGDRNITGASVTRFADGFAGKSHQFEAGAELERTTFRQVLGFPGGRSFQDAAGVPEQVTLWSGDTVEGTGTRTTVYAQDVWSATSRLTIHPGVRLGVNRGSVPDKGTVFKTSPVSPRIGVAWDVMADHRTVARAAYGRFHEGLFTSVFDFMNTSGVTPRVISRVLGPDTFQEINRITPGNAGVDEHLAHAYVDQYLVGIERELFPDFSLTAQYVRRNFDKIWARINTASRYEPVQRRDPGPDGRLGTPDDGALMTVFNLLNPGQLFSVLSNPDDAFRRYDAVQAIGQKRFSRNWQLLAAYTWSNTRGTVNNTAGENRASGADTGPGGIFGNPNRRINAEGRSFSDYTHEANLEGTYLLSAWGGVTLSGGYRYLSGAAWGRTAVITGLQQGNQSVRVEPRGTRRVDGAGALDLRIEKTFPLGSSGRTLGVYADAFNITNQGVPLALGVVEASGATFGQPGGWAAPRTVQVAGRLKF